MQDQNVMQILNRAVVLLFAVACWLHDNAVAQPLPEMPREEPLHA